MAHSGLVRIACAWISVLLLTSPAVVGGRQIAQESNDAWKLVSSYGFRVWIASNFVIDAPALSHRQIYLSIDAKDFTEANMRTVFTSFAAEFQEPHELWIYAYSDRAVVQKPWIKERAGFSAWLLPTRPRDAEDRVTTRSAASPNQAGIIARSTFAFQMAESRLNIARTLSRNTSSGLTSGILAQSIAET